MAPRKPVLIAIRDQIVAHLHLHPEGLTRFEIAKAIGLNPYDQRVYNQLRILEEEGRLRVWGRQHGRVVAYKYSTIAPGLVPSDLPPMTVQPPSERNAKPPLPKRKKKRKKK